MKLDRAAAERAITSGVGEPARARPRRGGAARSSRSRTRTWPTRCGSISIRRGYDPREFALVVFGGAGPLHGAALAAGALDPDSARASEPGHHLGTRLPARRRPPRPLHDVPRRRPAQSTRPSSKREFDSLEAEARERLEAENVPADQMHLAADHRHALPRTVAIALGPRRAPGRPRRPRSPASTPSTSASTTTGETRLRSRSTGSACRRSASRRSRSSPVFRSRRRSRRRAATRSVRFDDGAAHETPVYLRDEIPAGATLDGTGGRRPARLHGRGPARLARRGGRVAEHPHARHGGFPMSSRATGTTPRPGHVRGPEERLHHDRRPDGGADPPHVPLVRDLRARLLVGALRREGRHDHAGKPGHRRPRRHAALHGQVDHRGVRGRHAARRRVRDERPVSRRHALQRRADRAADLRRGTR